MQNFAGFDLNRAERLLTSFESIIDQTKIAGEREEVAALLEQRNALQRSLAERQQTLKQQIDQLRDALCAIQVMDQ